MKIGIKVIGDIVKDFQRTRQNLRQRMTRSMKEAGDGLKNELRDQVTRAGMGQKLAKTWRSQVYPKGQVSMAPAALVWSKAPDIIRAFDDGVTIRGRDGLWLAIPTENAPRRGTGGKRISPSTFPEGTFGKLRFVYLKQGKALLVVDNMRASYSRKDKALRGFRPASKRTLQTGRGLTTVVMFILVRQVTIRKRLNVESAAKKWHDNLIKIIDRNLSDAD